MTELKILICGAGTAGNALAYWPAQQQHDVTVIERHPDLRSTGL
jgi:2-polyprenyl-6-methoxyphenol hydroxylase-like FAD-dependent oxidoreductase